MCRVWKHMAGSPRAAGGPPHRCVAARDGGPGGGILTHSALALCPCLPLGCGLPGMPEKGTPAPATQHCTAQQRGDKMQKQEKRW